MSTNSGLNASTIEVSASPPVGDVALVLENAAECLGGDDPVRTANDRDLQLTRQLADYDIERVDVSAVSVEKQNAAEPVARHRGSDAPKQGKEGLIIKRYRAAERHVVFGKA